MNLTLPGAAEREAGWSEGGEGFEWGGGDKGGWLGLQVMGGSGLRVRSEGHCQAWGAQGSCACECVHMYLHYPLPCAHLGALRSLAQEMDPAQARST